MLYKNRKIIGVYLLIFVFMFFANYLTPVYFGDDIAYSYKWQEGQKLTDLLPMEAVCIDSFADLFISIKNHYHSWHGRITSVFWMFFWGWAGKEWFNICNAFMSVALVFLVQLVATQISGQRKINVNCLDNIFIFLYIWVFLAGWNEVFLWQSGAVSYLWPMVGSLLFLLVYLKENSMFRKWWITLPLGAILGCTNENNIPSVILLCLLFIHKSDNKKLWQTAGVAGLAAGFVAMVLSPSVKGRLISELSVKLPYLDNDRVLQAVSLIREIKEGQILPWLFQPSTYMDNIVPIMLFIASVFPLIYFCKLCLHNCDSYIFKIKAFLYAAVLSSVIMLFSPFVPLRSLFFSFIYVLIAAMAIYRQNLADSVLQRQVKVFYYVLILYFIISFPVFIYWKTVNYYNYQDFDAYMSAHKGQAVEYVLPVNPAWAVLATKNTSFYNNNYFMGWMKHSVIVKYGLKSLNFIKAGHVD